jgi:glycosyltransferase involved in cell wall biosynthesis
LNREISIIIPSYNSERYIGSALESVYRQSVLKECFILDNNSKDNTRKIIENYESAILKYWSEEDNGQSHAINKGIEKVSGSIINWLNTDDYYEPDALEKVASAFNSSVNAVGGISRVFDSNGTKYYSSGTDIYPENLPKTLGWARIDQPETFFQKSVWDKVGPLNENLHYVFDREWWIRYLFHFGLDRFKKIPDVLVNFRHHDNSKTVSSYTGFVRESRQVYAAYARNIGEFEIEEVMLETEDVEARIELEIPPSAEKELIQSMIHYHLLLVGNQYYAENKSPKAQQFLERVEAKYLAKEDRKLLKKLYFRNQLPNRLVNIARNLKERLNKTMQ